MRPHLARRTKVITLVAVYARAVAHGMNSDGSNLRKVDVTGEVAWPAWRP
jgi:hypothetical protein